MEGLNPVLKLRRVAVFPASAPRLTGADWQKIFDSRFLPTAPKRSTASRSSPPRPRRAIAYTRFGNRISGSLPPLARARLLYGHALFISGPIPDDQEELCARLRFGLGILLLFGDRSDQLRVRRCLRGSRQRRFIVALQLGPAQDRPDCALDFL